MKAFLKGDNKTVILNQDSETGRILSGTDLRYLYKWTERIAYC